MSDLKDFLIIDGVLKRYKGQGGDVVIPDGVVKIGDRAFKKCEGLHSVTIPEGVISIGKYAFESCERLTDVILPKTLETIEEGAFKRCGSIDTLILQDGVKSLGYYAFGETVIQSIVWPESLVDIDDDAFELMENFDVFYKGHGECACLANRDDVDYLDGGKLFNIYSYRASQPTEEGNFWRFVSGVPTPWPKYTTADTDINSKCFQIKDGVLIKYKGPGGHVDIPNGVTEIGEVAFAGCERLRSVTIPEGVTYIGESAFSGCERLAKVNFPQSLKAIDIGVFDMCNSLESVVLPDNVEFIGGGAFSGTSLDSIVMPESVRVVGAHAFYAHDIVDVYYKGEEGEPWFENDDYDDDYDDYDDDDEDEDDEDDDDFEDVEYIFYHYRKDQPTEEGHFWHYVNGKPTPWPEYGEPTTKSISNKCSVYVRFPNNRAYWYNYDGEISIDDRVYVGGKLAGQVGVVEDISAWDYSPYMQMVTEVINEPVASAPKTVVTSEPKATAKATTKVTTTGVSKVVEVPTPTTTVTSDLKDFVIEDGVLIEYNGDSDIVVIPEEVVEIGEEAFIECESIVKVVIPDGVTEIGYCAFCSCCSLESIVIPDSVKYIGESAFGDCYSLTSIVLPKDLEYLGENAFDISADRLVIYSKGDDILYPPEDEEAYEDDEFGFDLKREYEKYTDFLRSVWYFYSADQPTEKGKFWHYVDGKPTIWTEYATPQKYSVYVRFANNKAYFYNYEGKHKIAIGDRVYVGGKLAGQVGVVAGVSEWNDAPYMQMVTEVIKEPVVSTPKTVVASEPKPKVTTTPKVEKSTLKTAVEATTKSTATSLPKIDTSAPKVGLTVNTDDFLIENGVLKKYKGKGGDVVIPDGVTKIDMEAFSWQKSITSVSIPDSVTAIEFYAFGGCSSLTSITIPSSVTSIGGFAFDGCSSLTSITIPSSVTRIGERAFRGCKGLTSITVLNSIISIGKNAFAGCTSLLKVNYIGTQDQWLNNIVKNLGNSNKYLTIATITYNYTVAVDKSTLTVTQNTFNKCSVYVRFTDNRAYWYNYEGKVSINDHVYVDGKLAGQVGIVEKIAEWSSSPFMQMVTEVIKGSPASTSPVEMVEDKTQKIYEEAVRLQSSDSIGDIGLAKSKFATILGYKDSAERIEQCTAKIDELKRQAEEQAKLRVYQEAVRLQLSDSIEDLEQAIFKFESIGDYKDSFERIDQCNARIDELKKQAEESKKLNIYVEAVRLQSSDKISDIEKAKRQFATISSYKDSATRIEQCTTKINELKKQEELVRQEKDKQKSLQEKREKQKKLLIVIIAAIGIIAILALVSRLIIFNDDHGLYYTQNADGTYSISGVKESESTVVLPEEYKGKPITAISAEAFRANDYLTSITIPNGITSIGNSAFEDCDNLTSITIPSSVKSIGESAFSGCENLKSITIPNGVTSIGNSAFEDCDNLTSITIPSSVKSIGESAFSGCENLKSITIPNGVTSIGDSMFSGCTSLTSITIPNGVTSIGHSVFAYCSSITSVSIPSSVTSIGESVFRGCGNLKSITIPNGVTSIKFMTFAYCKSLTSIIIPSSVTSIGYSAFEGCEVLTNLTIPGSVKSIEEQAFKFCSQLNSVTILNGVTSIGDSAFAYCSSLTSITIPSSVTSIGRSAFEGCKILTNLTILGSVTNIGYDAFKNCPIEQATIPAIASTSIKNSKLTSVVITSGDTIPAGAFNGCSSLTSITIPNSVTSIDDKAFYGCSSLTSITIPSSVTSIGKSAFSGCSSLTSITIPNGVTSIGQYAFEDCTGLTSITLPFVGASRDDTSNTHFGYIFGASSFSYNDDYVPSSLKTVVITGGSSIADRAFQYCSGLTSIVIPDSVTAIGRYAFYSIFDSSLTSVYYKGTAQDWAKISIDTYNSPLTSATRYYYSETRPTTSGNYWHYVNGVPTKW